MLTSSRQLALLRVANCCMIELPLSIRILLYAHKQSSACPAPCRCQLHDRASLFFHPHSLVCILQLAESLESFPQDAVIVSLALRALLNLADHKADPPARRQLIDMAPSLLTLLHAHAANAKVVTLTLGVLAALVQAFPGSVLVGQGDALRRGVEAARLRHVGHAGVEDQAGSLLSKL
jgi:hypothetical protein